MLAKYIILLFSIAAALAQNSFSFGNTNKLRCQLACSTQATFTTLIDGIKTTARCSDSKSSSSIRCDGCCGSVALAAGLTTDRAAGFPSTNGACVCCIRAC